jgi:cytochrome c nitrite reductase small subunit
VRKESAMPDGAEATGRRRRFAGGAGFALASALVGIAVGTAGFTFVYGRGASYLTNDPAACANCHVMEAQYSSWLQGSHRNAAVCNDCHTPKDHVGKYVVKARNGFWHSFYFTVGGFHEPIRIKPGNREITEGRCRSCHAEVVDLMEAGHPEPVSCLRCHDEVGHAN